MEFLVVTTHYRAHLPTYPYLDVLGKGCFDSVAHEVIFLALVVDGLMMAVLNFVHCKT